ncbi:hypothetical protein AA18890_3138 [Komagataeibacter europaeus LMG 18890]|nr:hypothetical protein AA18890_3138 [Komagataeibacter europaeus LMG 18890]
MAYRPYEAAVLLQAGSILNVYAEASQKNVGSCLTEALVIHAPHDLRLDPVSILHPGSDEVRVNMAWGGICGSDLHYFAHGGVCAARSHGSGA